MLSQVSVAIKRPLQEFFPRIAGINGRRLSFIYCLLVLINLDSKNTFSR